MKVLLAGDTHGDLGWVKLLIARARFNGCPVVLQCGDFGYWEHRGSGRDFLDRVSVQLKRARIELWWIDGNHECHTLLRSKYALGGDDRVLIRPNLYYLQRGHRWQWDGRTFLALGGAYSIDKLYRTPGESWWQEETITEGEVHRACEGGRADVLVSHDCPVGVDPFGPETVGNKDVFPESLANRKKVTAVVEEVRPSLVVHGHYHHRHSSRLRLADGSQVRVEGFGMNGDFESFGVLDCDSLTVSKAQHHRAHAASVAV